ncbi:MAG: RNA polymerase subunit sigma [Sphingobacteriales bacterium 17-39-43]|uniref:RNA polymerase sigma factor n=1 Tax=Daejeonella sp. TaxID=2805397 RepID=UPI000BD80881|nr:sigma-70 family RNA polymerase sigma factor [Daejeonella sp.]OYY02647.1 MAG: RNA polymerase subunit sigma [Sphingobacteriia bacterium 35-40-5]OYZ32565.1 MAG: RNA polymerase subunit sigma [Sphingobacteriales bacterium 16-39-50]OYZ51092.1 MAG: RNA polymerase subunit sigma [Sphingobacteriales bacterium 24-40-4]OZA25928.1 MAG: RNA polymerase subunit sigma [Sphingobacteriales bacterium 17-39-43]OZA61898.1 MAG: RNA polymerase subunit sigma [Sphingobacteriales bacterium 39-40-5]
MQKKYSDTELIDKVLGGDKAAYADLMKRHQRFVFTLALRFAKNREDAEEIAQDCFIKAYRSLNTFRNTSKFSTWLYSIVYTTAMTFLRKKRLDIQSIDTEAGLLNIENHVSDLNSDEVEHKSKMVFVNRAIDQLLPDDAAVITLFYQGEQSLDEIGKALGMETNTVKVKLHRARHRLKEKIENILHHEVRELL